MNNDLNPLKQSIAQAFSLAHNAGIDDPVDLARLGLLLLQVDADFTAQKYGAEKLRTLLEKIPDTVQLIKDDTIHPPRYFASHLSEHQKNSYANDLENGAASLKGISQLSSAPKPSQAIPTKFSDFAFIHSEKWLKLAELCRPEPWGDEQDVPLLRNYIRHTFSRLVYEKKVIFSLSGEMAVFNTGLVDRRFQPIYALLKTNERGTPPWFLDSFCVAGENFSGKQLVKVFRQLPEAAYYFNNPTDIFFDINAQIYTDWEHVIEENIDRIPLKLLERTARDLEVKSCKEMSEDEVDNYKQEVANYLKQDDFAYRMIIKAFDHAMELALKKVRWNYKTAIPVYYPPRNKMHILLPLCLISEERVDVALVVERTESGNYQGHTIYPLEWAYSNSRLIARPESEWLRADAK